MRGVKQRHAFASERQGDLPLLSERIIAGRLGDGPEILAQRGEGLRVARRAEEDELGLPIEPRQLPQQIPDIGADAEVAQLSRVYTDAHGLMIPAGLRIEGGGPFVPSTPR